MRAVGLKDLKNKLSEYVRVAAGGETVLITNHDRVVAELVPPAAGRAIGVGDAALAHAVREGLVTPALTGPGTVPPSLPVATLEVLLAELRADRDGG